MSHVLAVPAVEIRNPVALVILAEAGDASGDVIRDLCVQHSSPIRMMPANHGLVNDLSPQFEQRSLFP
jgi:hypothetical protein